MSDFYDLSEAVVTTGEHGLAQAADTVADGMQMVEHVLAQKARGGLALADVAAWQRAQAAFNVARGGDEDDIATATAALKQALAGEGWLAD